MNGRWAIAAAMLAGAPAMAQQSAGPKGNPGQYFGPDEYPVDALRAGQQGRTVAGLWIDDTGKVVSCTIASSSGSDALDQATCRIALARVRFTPAIDRRGHPIASQYTLPVRWVLPTGPADVKTLHLDQTITITVSVDAAGTVVACQGAFVPQFGIQLSPCDGYPVGKQTEFRWTREGKPVGGVITRTVHTVITPDL